MQFPLLFVIFELVGTAAAIGPTHFNCGTLQPSAELLSAHSKLRQIQGQDRIRAQGISVNTYFHVISGDANSPTANDDLVQQQLRVMNSLFSPQAISFNLISTSYTLNSTWARDGDDSSMKNALHRGTYRDLNLYIQPSLQSSVIGRCTLPASGGFSSPSSPFLLNDGCNLDVHTFPGGSYSEYNQGKTAVHEIGHWFGLLHTFQGGCGGDGDYVADTPAEMTPTQGCPAGKDTCAGGGVDPINNYMDYSSDPCYTQFTPGQGQRMMGMFWMYRS